MNDDAVILPAIRSVVIKNHKDDSIEHALVFGEHWQLTKEGEIMTNFPLGKDEYLDIRYEMPVMALIEEGE